MSPFYRAFPSLDGEVRLALGSWVDGAGLYPWVRLFAGFWGGNEMILGFWVAKY